MNWQSLVTTARRLFGSVPPMAAASLVLGLALGDTVWAASVTVKGSDGSPISDYRWTIEEDATYHVAPGAVDANTLAVRFHQSYMPVVASGSTFGDSPSDPGSVPLEPLKHYFISVLPRGGYSNSGAPIGPGQASVVVIVDKLPLPTAQISVFVFEDISPINNAPDVGEHGLAGFVVRISDILGDQTQDAFGNPLGTKYEPCSVPPDVTFPACTQPPAVSQLGNGTLTTDANGEVLIQNLHPGKYGVTVTPRPGQGWSQTSTIEGRRTVDAWVRSNEPPYFIEFGPPVPHTFFGFVKPMNLFGSTGATITGQVVNTHTNGPPFFELNEGAPFAHTNPWIGINDLSAGGGTARYARRADADGFFTISGVPPGTYQLVVWDDYLDIIFAFRSLIVSGNGTIQLGTIPVFNWFNAFYSYVFEDINANGLMDAGEPGIPEQAINLRFRDGSVYQSYPTDGSGFVPFEQVFPFFAWQVAEVDFAKFKPTGMTFFVDEGGPLQTGWAPPGLEGFEGLLTPRRYPNPLGGPDVPYRSIVADPAHPAAPLLMGFQGFAGQSNLITWGKTAYPFPGDADNAPYGDFPGPGDFDDGCEIGVDDPCIVDATPAHPGTTNNEVFEPGNGGIAGVVTYGTTRAENDPRLGAAEPWEPGVPRVTVRLWNADRTVLYNETETDSWDDSPPTGCDGPPFVHQGQPTDCFDGLRNWNQIKEAVFDGGYAFDSRFMPSFDSAGAVEVPGLPAGDYVVEVIPPPGYELVKEEDKNVDFGDEFFPARGVTGGPPAVAGLTVPILNPECVGDPHTLPAELDLFPGVPLVTDQLPDIDPLAGIQRPLCDRKLVDLRDGQNASANFFLFTKAPVAGHISGVVLDDLANEGETTSPQFGEKFAPPNIPISIRDWANREVNRVYTDQYGRYNALVPSTYTINPPAPSGVGPKMMAVCLNDPTKPDPNSPTQLVPEPYFNRAYGQVCLTFNYQPGTTTHLDTPVIPVAAFAGVNQFPVDCEFADHTPVIYSVSAPAASGPYIPFGATSSASRTLTIVSAGSVAVPNPEYDGPAGSKPKTITRDYGFGTTAGSVSIGGVAIPGASVSWSPGVITAAVPNLPLLYRSGQLVVTRADNGRASVTGLTVTIGTSAADNAKVKSVSAGGSIQAVLDLPTTAPDDLVLVPPGTYNELVVMSKPVRLQGWGAASATINARKQPAEKLGVWRTKVAGRFAADPVELPGQAGIGPFDGEGPGVMVLGKDNSVAVSERFGQVGTGLGIRPNSRIDGFTISGADTAGAIFVNGYAHYLEISNNRIAYNSGYYGGGIRIGHPNINGVYVNGQNDNISIHNNHINQNGTEADALQGAVGGGVSLYTGSVSYNVTQNFVCGNFTVSNGGGIGHSGLSGGGRIVRNTIVFNESFNQGMTVNGGGIFIGGGDPLGGATLSPGSGSVAVNANLIQGNAASGGDGGGIRVERANGQDAQSSPGNSANWSLISITNNMITDNVAALAGAGISLQDAARVNIIHNTIANNDSLATAGEAFLGAPNESTPQPAGIVSRAHSVALRTAIGNAAPAGLRVFSNPLLDNNILWHNRSFHFGPTPGEPLPFGLLPDPATPVYSDFGVLGVTGGATLTPRRSILTNLAGTQCTGAFPYGPAACNFADPNPTDPNSTFANLVRQYVNRDRSYSFLNDRTPIGAPGAFDEGGNFIRPRYGPLTLTNPATIVPGNPNTPLTFRDSHITAGRPGFLLSSFLTSGSYADLQLDFDGTPPGRPGPPARPDIGADEIP